MGIVDSQSIMLKCEKCGATEESRTVQRGSAYRLGDWDDFSSVERFNLVAPQGRDGPEVTSAECKGCKVPAKITYT